MQQNFKKSLALASLWIVHHNFHSVCRLPQLE